MPAKESNSTVLQSSEPDEGASPTRESRLRHLVLLAFLFWLAAGALYFGRSLWMKRLPADYHDIITFDCVLWNRVGHTEKWEENPLIARQVDETLVAVPVPSKIQSTIHWTTLQGVIYYETTGLYGVNPHTGENEKSYGNRQRHGQFVFPLHTEKKTYTIWDAYYTGPRNAKFSHVEKIGPIDAYVFSCWVDAFDDTGGYLYLDDVPERYRALSEGTGKVWIDPVSGVMLDFYDEGKSTYTDAATGEKGAVFLYWVSQFTSTTKEAHLKMALESRQRIFWREIGVPVSLLVAGGLILVFRRFRIARRRA